MSKQQLKERGFTIIEVVLVLAIAALIFLMVFVALPALQRSQRDTARKNDVDTIAAAAQQVASNNKNDMSKVTVANIKNYLGTSLSNIDVANITKGSTGAKVNPGLDKAVFVTGAKCGDVDGQSVTVSAGPSKSIVVVTSLEAGGASTVPYCVGS